MGSYHSLTPCVSSPGTIVDMKALDKIVTIDAEKMTFTAQAGLEMIEAADALRKQKLQFILNIEIGNMTLGSAACCHTKDALDGVGFGQVNSFVTGVKWVSPSGTLEEASEEKNPELLPLIRASYGLAGIVYEVTFKIKPLEIIRVRLRGARRRRGHPGSHLGGHRVERVHGLLDGGPQARHPDPQSRDRAETRLPGRGAALRLELSRRLRRARDPADRRCRRS